jgi:hypothetical protein
VRGRVCGRIGPLVHWYLCVVAVRAGGRARTWPVRSGRARESRGPVRFTRARGASPDSAAAAQGHFCHTLSVRRWPGASPQRGGRLVVRPAAPASRKHPVVIGAGCAARERRWKGPMPSFSALSAWHSRRRGRILVSQTVERQEARVQGTSGAVRQSAEDLQRCDNGCSVSY